MKFNKVKAFVLVLLLGATVASCKKVAVEENDEEVLTTLQLTFTPAAGGSSLVYKFDDPDGPGGNAPTTDQIVLAPNTTYNVSIAVLNKTASPVADITSEILTEAIAHRFYFIPASGTNISVSNLSKDVDGISVGLTSTWTTGAAATGSIQVVLRHYPGTPPNKAESDDVSSTKSGTDIEATFATKIQ
ncbi:MAG: hypothetical protein K2P88_13010 [Chitinophagaceae bacterium]|nr:hypothetical protein [Chitinophagaceae bacterium]